jgi:hypothetical protein
VAWTKRSKSPLKKSRQRSLRKIKTKRLKNGAKNRAPDRAQKIANGGHVAEAAVVTETETKTETETDGVAVAVVTVESDAEAVDLATGIEDGKY